MYNPLLTRCFIFFDTRFDNICLQKVDCVCFVADAVEKAIFCDYLVLTPCIIGFDRNQGLCLFKQGHFLPYTWEVAVFESYDKPPAVGCTGFEHIVVGILAIGGYNYRQARIHLLDLFAQSYKGFKLTVLFFIL